MEWMTWISDVYTQATRAQGKICYEKFDAAAKSRSEK